MKLSKIASTAILAAAVLLHASAQENSPPTTKPSSSDSGDAGQQTQLGAPVHAVDPIVPKAVRHKSASAVIGATLKMDGTFANLSALGGDRDFEDAALGAMHQWLYTPATLNAKPVDADVFVIFRYMNDDVQTKLELNPPFPKAPKTPGQDLVARGRAFSSGPENDDGSQGGL